MVIFAMCLGLVAVIQVVCVLALIDQYKGLLQIRTTLGLVDTPRQIEIAPSAPPLSLSGLGLPNQLEQADHAILVFLSTKCTTCRMIGSSLRGHVPAPLWMVVEGPSQEACDQWLSEVGLPAGRVTTDVNGQIVRRLNLEVVPAAAVFTGGAFRFAQTLPSFRQLEKLLVLMPTSFAATS